MHLKELWDTGARPKVACCGRYWALQGFAFDGELWPTVAENDEIDLAIIGITQIALRGMTPTNATFRKITASSQTNYARRIQLNLKFIF